MRRQLYCSVLAGLEPSNGESNEKKNTEHDMDTGILQLVMRARVSQI